MTDATTRVLNKSTSHREKWTEIEREALIGWWEENYPTAAKQTHAQWSTDFLRDKPFLEKDAKAIVRCWKNWKMNYQTARKQANASGWGVEGPSEDEEPGTDHEEATAAYEKRLNIEAALNKTCRMFYRMEVLLGQLPQKNSPKFSDSVVKQTQDGVADVDLASYEHAEDFDKELEKTREPNCQQIIDDDDFANDVPQILTGSNSGPPASSDRKTSRRSTSMKYDRNAADGDDSRGSKRRCVSDKIEDSVSSFMSRKVNFEAEKLALLRRAHELETKKWEAHLEENRNRFEMEKLRMEADREERQQRWEYEKMENKRRAEEQQRCHDLEMKKFEWMIMSSRQPSYAAPPIQQSPSNLQSPYPPLTNINTNSHEK